MDALLRVEKVSKAFPGVQALDNVSLDVRSGEVVGLIGENGAGKSTLIKILAGVHRPDSGKIYFAGQEVTIPDPQASQEVGISVIFQELNLLPNLSVAENIFVGRELRRFGLFLDRKETERRSLELMRRAGLSCDPWIDVEALSLSRRQMVEVAKALSIDARLIIMDEPTSALTEQEVDTLFTIVQRLKERNVAVIFVSHKLDEVFRICDRLHVLRDGKDVGTTTQEEASHDKIIRMMVGRDIGSLFVKEDAEIGPPVLEVRNLSSPNGVTDVSFSVHRGEILGFAGLVGSGRTEVMRAVFGIDPHTSGEILVDGDAVDIRIPSDAIRHGIGFVPEDRQLHGLILGMTVRQNITLPGLQFVSSRGFIQHNKEREVTSTFIDRLRIRTPHQEQTVLNLSGGNQQKVVVSKWLAINPRILILDEPTRGIDVGAKKEIHRLMTELAKRGVAIIMISSELPEVLAMSDRIVVMHEGRKRGELSRNEASQERIMETALRGSVKEETHGNW
ncbi:MAG: sugar ABC transporter ATP-binding protein [Spirochaetaceae bacterium]